MEYQMGNEKIEQNIDRVSIYVFHTLGCGIKDAEKIFTGVLKKRKEAGETLPQK